MGLWQNGSLCKYSLSLVLAMTSMVKPGEILVILLTWCVSYQTHTLFEFYSKLTWISSTVITKRGTKWPELLSDWKVVLIIMRCCSSGWRRHSVWQCDSVTVWPPHQLQGFPPPSSPSWHLLLVPHSNHCIGPARLSSWWQLCFFY